VTDGAVTGTIAANEPLPRRHDPIDGDTGVDVTRSDRTTNEQKSRRNARAGGRLGDRDLEAPRHREGPPRRRRILIAGLIARLDLEGM
jgi:hypothetical protein